jgi:hypothetical protein
VRRVGGEVAQPAHDIDGAARWEASVEVIDRPFGCQQQIVQAGDGDAGVGRDPAQLGPARGGQDVRLVTQRERRDLQPS